MAIRVNGTEITEEAVQFELSRLVRFYSEHLSEAEVRKQLDLLRRRARDQAIGARLLVEEAANIEFLVPPNEISDRLEEMLEEAGGRQAFDEMCRRQQMTEEMVREAIARGRRVDMLIERITEGIPDPTEDEIRAHYEAHVGEYTTPERAQAQHLLVRPASGAEQDRETARSRLLDMRRQIEEGAAFSDMATMYSDCPSGKSAGGSLGWVSRGTMVPGFDEALFSLEDGALSDVVESQFGFHLIHRTAHEPEQPADFEDVREKILSFLRHVRRGETIAAHVEDLKKAAVIEED